MDEAALDLTGVTLSPQKETVRAFYKDMWDHADKSLIPHIFHEGFTFRGSLGPTLVGFEQFAGYVDFVTATFDRYTTDIIAMIEEDNRVSGKMRFHGLHRKEIFGVAPSGRHVWWTGMPIFTFDGSKVRDLYVLGDIFGLIGRLKDETA
ncbi:MAG: ester cyclase [Proteobacteria bacterium]|nr:ester cyclase [Pseudomonadota bacterium]